jgi:hypothetical protein
MGLLLVCSTARASQWVALGNLPGEETGLFVDSSGIHLAGKIRHAPVKELFVPHSHRGMDDKWVSQIVMDVAFDCNRKTLLVGSITIYYEDQTTQTDNPVEEEMNWGPAQPGSPWSTGMQLVCASAPK